MPSIDITMPIFATRLISDEEAAKAHASLADICSRETCSILYGLHSLGTIPLRLVLRTKLHNTPTAVTAHITSERRFH